MYDYDDLDRALFALPLEEAPSDLRDSILAVTVRAPREVLSGPAFGSWEVAIVGGVLALATWLGFGVLTNPAWGPEIAGVFHAIIEAFTNFSLLGWIVAGASTAFWLSITNLRPQRSEVRPGNA